MMHQRIGIQDDAQSIATYFDTTTMPRHARPATRRSQRLPSAWWIVPFVIAGATIWIGGIAYGIQMIMGAA